MRSDQITSYLRLLEREGWTYAFNGEWWKAYYQTPDRRISVYIGYSNEAVVWQLPLPAHPSSACRPAIYRYLLLLNHSVQLVKFSLSPDNRISLNTELPFDLCSFSAFRAVLSALHTYFEQYHTEIELLAESAVLARVWMQMDAVPDEPSVSIVLS
jgi:hypothetical protein